jgi:ABC-type branched-subunit amino acid transport system ATPase component
VPDATACPGRIYIIINSNGTGSTVTLTAVNGQVIFDDVTGTHYETTGLPQNSRIKIQSDGANWIVTGN